MHAREIEVLGFFSLLLREHVVSAEVKSSVMGDLSSVYVRGHVAT